MSHENHNIHTKSGLEINPIDEIKKHIGPLVVIALAIVPIFLWAWAHESKDALSTYSKILTAIGQITGLVGIVLFAITLVLSARLRIYRPYFGGLNKEYNIHQMTGVIGFLLILVHPLVLAAKYIPISLVSAALFLVPGGDVGVDLGIASLALMITFLVTTLFTRFRYELLKFLHKLLGVAFMLGVIHMYLVPSEITSFFPLKVYMFSVAGLGIAAYIYRSILGRLVVPKYPYEVVAVTQKGNDVVEIEMRAIKKTMQYNSGQFIFVHFNDPQIGGEAHPFSISSSPTDPTLKVTIKKLGDYTSNLHRLVPGSVAQVEGPYGRFFYEGIGKRTKHMVWIAGGIGITPFLSMARSFEREVKGRYSVDLYYCTKNEDELLYIEELQSIAAQNPSFRIIPQCSSTDGFLTAEQVAQRSGGVNDKDIFVCGPPTLMNALKKQFMDLGVSRFRIHLEEFKML